MRRGSKHRAFLPRFFRSFLVTLLALGTPGSGFGLAASEPTAPEPGAAALSVASDPQGASVYVNGELQGATPLTLDGMASGEHRVRLVKDGYLENSRVVSVKAGQPGAVQVKLTPERNEARHALQQEPDEGGGGGGSKKALWIGLGVAAVGAGAYFLLRDTNEPPVGGTVSASPTTALAGLMPVTFTAQGASDPDGDTLTFNWNFGDGSTGTGATATHTYQAAGTFNVTLTVSDGEEQATATGATVTVRSLAGAWSGRHSVVTNNFSMNLTQNGGTLGGTMTIFAPNAFSGPIVGTAACSGSSCSVTLNSNMAGGARVTMTGATIAPDLNRISGSGVFSAPGFGPFSGTYTWTR